MDEFINSFNMLDYFYMTIMLISLLIGMHKGFIISFFSILAWIVSGIVSTKLSPYIIEYVHEYFVDYCVAQIAVAVGLYLIFLTFFLIVTHSISKKITESSLSDVNKLVGGIFGILRGLVLPLGVCIVINVLNIDYTKVTTITGSKISMFIIRNESSFMPYVSKYKNMVFKAEKNDDIDDTYTDYDGDL